MKKNRVYWSMLGISVALHGAVMFGMAGDSFYTPPPFSEDQFVSTLKMVKLGTSTQKATSTTTPIDKTLGQKIVEKPVNHPSEFPPAQETVPDEETWQNGRAQEGDSGNNAETRNGEVGEGGTSEGLPEGRAEEEVTMTDSEYAALMVYIKDFIDKNLIYPPMARRRNIQGIAGVSFEIEKNCKITSITVDHSSGSAILDNAAVSLIKKIHFFENITIKRELALRVNIEYKLTE
jgi:TonB family protein